MSAPTVEDRGRVDAYLATGEVLLAVVVYRQATGAGIAGAKEAIGERLWTSLPEAYRTYRDVDYQD
jgi:hypothetical protein